MRRLWPSLAVLVFVAGSAPSVRAEETPPDDPVLAALVEDALRHSPELAAAGDRASAAHRRSEQARALPPSMVSVLYTNDGWAPTLGQRDMTTLAFMASQPIPYPGTAVRRAQMLERRAQEAERRTEREHLDLIAAVTRGYHELRLASAQLELAREQEALWQEIEASARARYAAGLGAQVEVLRAQVEVTRSGEQIVNGETDVTVRRAELNRRAGRPLDRPLPATPPLRLYPLDRSAEDVLREAEESSPERHATLAATEARELEIDLVRREQRPALTAQAGYMNRAALDPMWQAGVSVSWPLLGRKRARAGVAAAIDEARASRREQEVVRADLELRTRQRLMRLDALARSARIYEDGILPQGRLALDAALAQYRAGRTALVAVLDALTTLVQDRAEYVRRVAAHETLKARLLSWTLEPDEGAMAASPTMRRTGMGTGATVAAGGDPTAASTPAPGPMSGMGEGR